MRRASKKSPISSYDPQTLGMLQEVFDAVWTTVGGNQIHPCDIAHRRSLLARIVLELSDHYRDDPGGLASEAIRRLSLSNQSLNDYRQRPFRQAADYTRSARIPLESD